MKYSVLLTLYISSALCKSEYSFEDWSENIHFEFVKTKKNFKTENKFSWNLLDLITRQEFNKAVTDNIYPAPSQEQYDTIMRMASTAGNITSKQELAMFLAQVLWESAGLQVIH